MILSKCRGCNASELEIFLDLGTLTQYVLKAHLHFNKIYPYFSRNSKTWVNHCYLSSTTLFERFCLNKNDLVIEIASNDGTYIQNFLNLGLKVLGIEPSANVAEVSIKNRIPTINQ